VAGPEEARQLPASASAGRPQHDDLAAGAGMPMAVPANSPSMNIRAPASRPGSAKTPLPAEVRDGDANAVHAPQV
jgi:hypothetical protein